MITLVLGEVRMTEVAREPVLILREVDGERTLPIWVSAAAAHAILAASDDPGRNPGIHDLLLTVLGTLNSAVTEARILSVEDGVYRAELRIGKVGVEARVSDAVALALRSGAPILATEELMDAVGVTEEPAADGEPPLTADDQMEKFRAFLDTINPDDFDAPGSQP